MLFATANPVAGSKSFVPGLIERHHQIIRFDGRIVAVDRNDRPRAGSSIEHRRGRVVPRRQNHLGRTVRRIVVSRPDPRSARPTVVGALSCKYSGSFQAMVRTNWNRMGLLAAGPDDNISRLSPGADAVNHRCASSVTRVGPSRGRVQHHIRKHASVGDIHARLVRDVNLVTRRVGRPGHRCLPVVGALIALKRPGYQDATWFYREQAVAKRHMPESRPGGRHGWPLRWERSRCCRLRRLG